MGKFVSAIGGYRDIGNVIENRRGFMALAIEIGVTWLIGAAVLSCVIGRAIPTTR